MISQGKVVLITGPMFSGKTTELIRLSERYELAGHKVLYIQYLGNTRDNGITTYNGIKKDSYGINDLSEINSLVRDYNVISVDEAQFISNLVIVDEWAKMGKIILLSCLNCDYKKNTFKNLYNILPLCDEIIKFTAMCKCGKEANFTKRINTSHDEIELIGGKDKYDSVCRNCY